MKLYELLHPERIALDMHANSREEVVQKLVNLLPPSACVPSVAAVINMVLKREKEVGTGVGYGVAIPHADPGPFPEPVVAFARLATPINFNAPDKVPARFIFLLLTPERRASLHVRMMARICRLSRSYALREKLETVTEPEEVVRLLAFTEADFPELNP